MSLDRKFVRLCGELLLLCFAGLALVLSGCDGGSNNSTNFNQPLTVEGRWQINASEAAGISGFTANIVPLTPQSGNCVVDTPLGQFHITDVATCFVADPNAKLGLGSIDAVTGVWDYPPAGFLIGVTSADPLPPNSTAQMSGFFVETDGYNVVIMDFKGSITTSTRTMSGMFSCDSQSPTACSYSGTFTATHQ